MFICCCFFLSLITASLINGLRCLLKNFQKKYYHSTTFTLAFKLLFFSLLCFTFFLALLLEYNTATFFFFTCLMNCLCIVVHNICSCYKIHIWKKSESAHPVLVNLYNLIIWVISCCSQGLCLANDHNQVS